METGYLSSGWGKDFNQDISIAFEGNKIAMGWVNLWVGTSLKSLHTFSENSKLQQIWSCDKEGVAVEKQISKIK